MTFVPPTMCARCGNPFTDNNPAKGGLLAEWYCGPCCLNPPPTSRLPRIEVTDA